MPVSARTYHDRTKHTPESVRGGPGLDWDNKPIPEKAYEGLPTVDLADVVRPSPIPALRAIAEPEGRFPPARPDLDALTQACWLSAGITRTIRRGDREMAFRAAACTGALYHVDLYLVAGDDPFDAGVYHFDPRTLSLDVLREGDYRGVVAGATGEEPGVGDAPVSVVLTSTWWRNAWKYRERTYRHAFWDSGTILANFLAVAHSLGLSAHAVTGFADHALASLLGVDPAEEAPVAVVPLGGGDPVPDSRPVEPIDPDTRPLSPNPRSYDLIREAYEASALPDGDAVAEWRDGSPDVPVGTRAPGDGPRVDLDPVGDDRAVKTPLHRAIRRRGSCREYERDTLNRRKVSTVLDRAVRGVPMDVGSGDPLAFTDCYLVVHDVADVPPGAYHYHPAEGTLERLRPGEFRREAGHLALDQRLAADAGLCAFFLADLDALEDRLGDRGYRVAQHEAAMAAGRLYLAAYAHRDLGATGLTFYDDLVTEFFAPRAAGQTPMFLWTLGRPA